MQNYHVLKKLEYDILTPRVDGVCGQNVRVCALLATLEWSRINPGCSSIIMLKVSLVDLKGTHVTI